MSSPETGTTIAACVFDGGVVLGADTRMTMGPYVCNRACNKIVPLYDNVFLCRSGSVADCELVAEHVHSYTEQHAISIGELPNVKTVANLTKLLNYQNPHLISALIVAGWDKHSGGQVYAVNIGGTLVPEKWMVEGSGSTYIWGICDSMFKPGMTREEAEEFISVAIGLAITRDGASGGMCRLVTITSDGSEAKFIKPKDLPIYPGDLAYPSVDTMALD
eukprot:g3494.t1